MSIPIDTKTWMVPRINPVSGVKAAGEVAYSPDREGAGAFSRILGDLMANSTAEAQNLRGNDKPLDREKILQLIQWMNLKMNERLLHSVGGDGIDVTARWKFDGLLPLTGVEGAGNNETSEPVPMVSSTDGKGGQTPEVEYLPPAVSSLPSGNRYENLIQKAAAAYDVDPELIKSVVQVESGFNASARSPKGAMGLMQLMPGTARDLGVANPYDPEENIMAGTRYLKQLLNRYDGNVSLALAAYNWGMGNLESRPGRMPDETRNYVSRITGLYKGNGLNIT